MGGLVLVDILLFLSEYRQLNQILWLILKD
jgi:hypothetical protein